MKAINKGLFLLALVSAPGWVQAAEQAADDAVIKLCTQFAADQQTRIPPDSTNNGGGLPAAASHTTQSR